MDEIVIILGIERTSVGHTVCYKNRRGKVGFATVWNNFKVELQVGSAYYLEVERKTKGDTYVDKDGKEGRIKSNSVTILSATLARPLDNGKVIIPFTRRPPII